MKAIYLDHNIIQYFTGYFPNSVDTAAEFAALAVAKSDPDCHFVLSPWSIFEASGGTDSTRIEAYASFIEGLSLWFIPDHPVLAKREMRRYVFRTYFGEDPPLESPFATCYSQHLTDLGIENVPVGKYTAAGMIRHYSRTSSAPLGPIDQQKVERPLILKQLQEAKAEGKMTAELERQVIQESFSIHFPKRYPNGTPIPLVERINITYDLVANQQEVLRECPTLWIDSLLADYRIENRSRNPQVGDAIDLMHAGSALVYCNAFVTYDGYTRNGAKRAVRTVETGCKVVSLLSALFPTEG